MTDVTTRERPQIASPQGGDPERNTIRGILQNPTTIARFKQIAPAHLNPERLMRVMAMAVYKTPKLAECEPMTLLGSMMACASLGLEPNTPLGHAYLIPFEKRTQRGGQWGTERVDVNLIIGYRGYVDLARRSGNLVSIHADVVYGAAEALKGDEFSFEYGSNMHLRHVPIGDSEGRPPIWAYAHASLKDGQAFDVLPYARVLRIRDNAEGYKSAVRSKAKNPRAFESSPWVAYEHEMAAKTMIRRLSKMLPLSIEFANAATLDAMSEANRIDFSAFADGVDMRTVDVDTARLPERDEDHGGQDAGPADEQQGQQQDAPVEVQTQRKVTPKGKPAELDDGGQSGDGQSTAEVGEGDAQQDLPAETGTASTTTRADAPQQTQAGAAKRRPLFNE